MRKPADNNLIETMRLLDTFSTSYAMSSFKHPNPKRAQRMTRSKAKLKPNIGSPQLNPCRKRAETACHVHYPVDHDTPAPPPLGSLGHTGHGGRSVAAQGCQAVRGGSKCVTTYCPADPRGPSGTWARQGRLVGAGRNRLIWPNLTAEHRGSTREAGVADDPNPT